MTRTYTLNERWGLQRSKEAAMQEQVNLRAFAPDADPLEQMYTNVSAVLCYGTADEQHRTLDEVGIPRKVAE